MSALDLPPETLDLHASTVAWGDRGLVIRGRSGSGKSALALDLMALGCDLVADDLTRIAAGPTGLVARCPEAGRGLIEARFLGLLTARCRPEIPVAAILDLDTIETERLPTPRSARLLGHDVPLFHKPATGAFAAAFVQYLKAGLTEP